jgi:hypothetical protein
MCDQCAALQQRVNYLEGLLASLQVEFNVQELVGDLLTEDNYGSEPEDIENLNEHIELHNELCEILDELLEA